MLNFIKSLLPRKIKLNEKAKDLPTAFGYSMNKFNLLIDELSSPPQSEENKIVFFNKFLYNPTFKKFKLNLKDSKHAIILGYALCIAMTIWFEKERQSQKKINMVLNAFHSNKKPNGTK